MRSFYFGAASALAMLFAGSAMADNVRILSIEPNTPREREYYADIVKSFEAENPGVTVTYEYMDDTSMKSKLPTLLQSSAKPDAFFTWTGGVFHEQADAGILKDISDELDPATKAQYSTSALSAMTRNGKISGVPVYAAGVELFYNKTLLEKAGVDATAIKTWDDFLTAVKKVKEAGITPVILPGKDKWPIAFYYGYLATRIAGTQGIARADEGDDNGFNNPDMIRAGQMLKQLADLQPFQSGFMDAVQPKGAGQFGDGQGAFYLMGNFLISVQAKNSTSGKGLGDDLGLLPFPAVADGKGDPKDTFGGINGYVVTKGAAPSTTKFLTYLTNKENQTFGGKLGIWLPAAKDSQGEIANPYIRTVAERLANAPHHQLYLDQALGASVGAALNDAAAQIVTGDITPEEAAKMVEEARQMR